MPKNPYFESAIHHFLLQARRIAEAHHVFAPSKYVQWKQFILSLAFKPQPKNAVLVSWKYPTRGKGIFSLDGALYYTQGNTQAEGEDPIKKTNDAFFSRAVERMGQHAGLLIQNGKVKQLLSSRALIARFTDEEHLSDSWARAVDVSGMNIKKINTAVTAPEMRYITMVLGNIHGKKILDIGCGLGEASVYFALLGAKVTAVDISRGMLVVTRRLARANNVRLRTVQSAIEHLAIPQREQFDAIYVGNVFHHVHISEALDQIIPHLTPKGLLVAWEPVDYNPIINIYREMARAVRSPFERPLRTADIQLFRRYFGDVRIRWFWLTTLLIFVIMFAWQRRDPNRERYWKIVALEGEKWRRLYTPLAALDRFLLALFPFLGPLCWNVVLVCKNPVKTLHL